MEFRYAFLMPFISFLIALFFVSQVYAFSLGPLDYSGYLRGGAGTNMHGGTQECFKNSGAPTNEFRLGNECGFYGEMAFTVHHLRAKPERKAFFFSQVRFSYFPKGYRLYDPNTTSPTNLTEAFVQGGSFGDSPLSYWIGKRYYRQIDAYILDWYYFADMSGVGAGIEQIPLSTGTLAVAHLFQTSDTTTSQGHPQLQFIDLRWNDIDLGSQKKLYFWSGYGWSPKGTGTDSGGASVNYVSTKGWLAGLRFNQKLVGGFADIALMYGSGIMESLTLYGTVPATDEIINKANRIRFVSQWVQNLSGRWGLMSSLAAEQSQSGADTDGKREWQSIGVRPIYFFSDFYQLAFEAGHSRVKKDSEGVGMRQLTRMTIAPQISMGKGVWARPVMRVFYTRSFWNEANKTYISNEGAPSFANETSGESYGYQMEVWF